jgi:hypothetical protein
MPGLQPRQRTTLCLSIPSQWTASLNSELQSSAPMEYLRMLLSSLRKVLLSLMLGVTLPMACFASTGTSRVSRQVP